MARCQATNPADSNCAEKLGPDYDFGGSSAILQTVNGKDILLAAGKGGVAIALDPDKEGKLLWRTQLWEDSGAFGLRSGGLGRRGRWRSRVLSAAAARRWIEGAGHQNRQGGLERRHQRGPARAGRSGQCDPGSRLHGRMGWDPARRGRRGKSDLVIQCRAGLRHGQRRARQRRIVRFCRSGDRRRHGLRHVRIPRHAARHTRQRPARVRSGMIASGGRLTPSLPTGHDLDGE